jgi:WD40 repeat protein
MEFSSTSSDLLFFFKKISGTQLAIGCEDGDVIVWNYPNVDIVFQMNRHLNGVHDIKWNPFEHDVLATIQSVSFDVLPLPDAKIQFCSR